MTEKTKAPVPFYVYERERDRQERRDKRNHWLIILLIILLFVSNIVWICVFNSYETVAYTQDGEGINSVNMGEQGDLINESDSNSQTEEEEQE